VSFQTQRGGFIHCAGHALIASDAGHSMVRGIRAAMVRGALIGNGKPVQAVMQRRRASHSSRALSVASSRTDRTTAPLP
jgi:hypothetical protein